MLNTEQDELITAVRVSRICHYATYLWQIDDEPKTIRRRENGEIETGGQDTVAIGYLGEWQ